MLSPSSPKLRLYSFVNFYLSSIQQGIQTAHLVHELYTKYTLEGMNPETEMLGEWAEEHKTIIVLNGGNADNIHAFTKAMCELEAVATFPHTYFREDDSSLDGIVTCAGIVLPDYVYDATLQDPGAGDFSDWTHINDDGIVTRHKARSPIATFLKMSKACSLAR